MYVRSKRRPFGSNLSPALARTLFAAMYALYPMGCVLRLNESVTLNIAGLAMITVAVLAFLVLAGSSLQRQAQEPDGELDERELSQRNRAAYRAYSVFAGLVLVGVIYMELHRDFADRFALWVPSSGEHWNAIFWGLLMLALTLPAAFLAWEKEPPLED